MKQSPTKGEKDAVKQFAALLSPKRKKKQETLFDSPLINKLMKSSSK